MLTGLLWPLFDESDDGIFVADARGRCVAVNRRGVELAGRCAEDLAGVALADLFAADPDRQQPFPLDELHRQPIPTMAACLCRQDGRSLSVEITARPIPEGRVLLVRDVAERRRVDDLLRFRTQAIECSNHGIGFADLHGCLTDVNPSFVRMFGYEAAGELVGGFPSALVESPDQVGEILAAIKAHGQWMGEVAGRKKNGERLVVQMSGVLVRNAAGIPVGVMGSFIDVTERNRMEAALRESEEQYRSLVESALDPMFRANAEGRFLFVNAVAAAMLGSTPEQIVGKTVDDLFPPGVAEMYRQGVRRVIQTGETTRTEDKSEIDGRTVWFSSIVQPIRDRSGQMSMAQAIVRDITATKQAESASREGERRLRQAIRVANIGIFEHDHASDRIYMSPEQREIYGLGPDEMIDGRDVRPAQGQPSPVAKTFVHPEDQERLTAALRRAHDPAGDGMYDIEHRHVRPDGTVRWVAVRSQTFFEGEGDARHPASTVGAVRDITEIKLAEKEKERLHLELVQASKMELVGRLAGGVAHDFNNMLNVITGYAELALARLEPSQPLYLELQQILNASNRSADLTRQLLAFARRQSVAPRVLDLNDVVAGLLKMLGRLIGEQIELVWTPRRELWSVMIDPSQVDQILANLAANARDAVAGPGRVTVRTDNVLLDDAYCARHPGAIPGDYVLLSVTDDGLGMDQYTLTHIFEPFFTTKEAGQGTGLGLATVYGIVKQNEGFIDVRSTVNQGTTVEIFLPRVAGEAAPALRVAPAKGLKTGTETLLVVEDQPMVLELTQIRLRTLGYTVLPASSAAEALRVAAAHQGKIQLLVTDVVMPGMNGRDLADRLHSLYPAVKCLFVSGHPAGASSPHVIAWDVPFLQKPFSIQELADKVREVLEGK